MESRHTFEVRGGRHALGNCIAAYICKQGGMAAAKVPHPLADHAEIGVLAHSRQAAAEQLREACLALAEQMTAFNEAIEGSIT